MLTQIADGVYVHEADCIQSNSVIVRGHGGVLLVDPGLTGGELETIASDLRELGQPVVAGFSTHPHWDHALWHASFGEVPRYATGAAVETLGHLRTQDDWEAQVSDGLPPQIAGEVPMDLLGLVTPLPAGATTVPWEGPEVRLIEHRAHAPGHAALWIEERGVLVAGDMLSDVLIPMLDLHGSADPIGDYLAALELLEGVAERAEVVVPGHGSVGGADAVRTRIDQDRAYIRALRDGSEVSDARIGSSAKPGWEWVSGVHEWQAQTIAQRRE